MALGTKGVLTLGLHTTVLLITWERVVFAEQQMYQLLSPGTTVT
jgi:hypothetical protein